MRISRVLVGAGLCALLSISCSKPPNEQYQKAQTALGEAVARTMDPSYAHPDFDSVELMFRAVPETATEYPVAREMADKIGMARQRAKAVAAAEKELEEAKARQAELDRQALEAAKKRESEVNRRTIISETPKRRRWEGPNPDSSQRLDRALSVGRQQRYQDQQTRQRRDSEIQRAEREAASRDQQRRNQQQNDSRSRCWERYQSCAAGCGQSLNPSGCYESCRRMNSC